MRRFRNKGWVRFCCYFATVVLAFTPVVNASMMTDISMHTMHGDMNLGEMDHSGFNMMTATQHSHHDKASKLVSSDQNITEEDSAPTDHSSMCKIACANCGNNIVQISVDKTQVKSTEIWKRPKN